jgi:phosphatidylglycerol---prolipoprotein diacylglyceryl transferase
MYPILFSLPDFTLFGHVIHPRFYSYGLCLAVALGFSIYLFARDAGKYIAPKMKLTYEQGFQKTFDLAVWVIISSILGARLFFVLENHDQFQGAWLDAFKIWQGGLVFYGGLFGAIFAAFIWFRNEKWPLDYSFDLVAPYVLLGHAIGRVGCFLNGCCYGNVSTIHNGIFDMAHGWVFPGGEDQMPHLPTQLWELYGDLALFFILLWVRRWTIRYSWLTVALYGLTYGTLRYVIEFWRRDWDKKYLVFFNSASQAVSGIIILASVLAILWIVIKYSNKKKPAK